MANKKKKGGLLKRPNTITGSSIVPKSLKPQQARQIIRRFHVLQKNKTSVINKLSKSTQLSIENYKEVIGERSTFNIAYQRSYSEFILPIKYGDNKLINVEHILNDIELVKELAIIDSEIDQRGGINSYQSASVQGQNNKRGGDSSKKLVEWLKELDYKDRLNDAPALEIGCLSPTNVISTCGIFKDIVRIDLNSQNHLILEQDFMARPLPSKKSDRFNLISCSLVINFVPSPKERGAMLQRITQFLKKPTKDSVSTLFLVLPLPCVSNSRYFDNKTLLNIMTHLGFTQTKYYEAKKVVYWLFDWNGEPSKIFKSFPKKGLNPGSSRNNFCITL